MNASRTLLLVIVALAAATLAFLFVPRGGGERSARVPTAEPAAGPAVREVAAPAMRSDEDPSPQELAAPGEAPRSARSRSAATAPGAPTTPLDVRVLAPPGAPADESLALLAIPGGARPEADAAELLETIRGGADGRPEHVRAPIDGGGHASLPIPADWRGARLLIDGRFLFVRRPVDVPAGADAAAVPAELGASLVVRMRATDGATPSGTLHLTGGDFSGRGGWDERERDGVDGGPLAFRGLDCDKTWTVLPELDAHHAYPRVGIEPEPGVETIVELELTPGAAVRGVVQDGAGQPLAGADVHTTNGSPWFGGADVRRGESDESGRFRVLGIAPGTVQLEAELDGWRSGRTEELELADGDELAGVRIVLERGQSIAGVVSQPDGAPAAGADVRVETRRRRQGWGGWGGPSTTRLGAAETDAEGRFRVQGLPDGGVFTVRASHPGPDAPADGTARDAQSADEPPPWRAAAEGIAAGTQDLALRLAAPISFAGRVLDDRGEPVGAFSILAESTQDGGPRERQDFESADGSFTFARVGPGEWSVVARSDGHVDSEPAMIVLPDAGGAELALRLPRAASIAGQVLAPNGAALAGALVRVDGADANPWQGPRGPRTESASDGRFLLEDVEPGPLALVAEADDWADSEAVAFDVAPGTAIEDARLVLRVGGRIAGGVVTPEGEPVAGRRVTWGVNAMGFGSRDETRTDGAGRFRFDHVTPGEWAVSAAPSMAEMAERMQGREGDDSVFVEVMGELVTETVQIDDGEVVEVWLGGEPRQPVRIFGEVTMAGEPLEDARVYAVSEGSAVFEGMKTAQVAADGTYALVVDRPGPYVVSASAERVGVERLVDVPRDPEVRVDLAVPMGRVEGRVSKAGGPAAGIHLRLAREDGLGRMRWNGDAATTDEEGRYAFVALEQGRYTVRANVSGWGTLADEDWGKATVDGVVVRDDATTSGVDLRLEKAGAIEGVVRGPDGLPLEDVTVFCRDAQGRLVTRFSGTETDSTGRFRQAGLGPGDYTLGTRAEGFASLDDVRVRVLSDETSTVELVAEPATQVVVTVEGDAGEALRARIEIFDTDGREVGAAISLRALRSAFNEGTSSLEQRLGPLPAGRYTVRATTTDGRTTEKRVRLRGRGDERSVTLRLGS